MPTNAHASFRAPFLTRLLASGIAASALVGLAVASPRTAADDTPPAGQGDGGHAKEKGDKKNHDDGLLSGPKVGDKEARDGGAFGKDGKPGRGGRPDGQRRPGADGRVWMETLKSMELQGDQKAQVDAVLKKFEDARTAFEKQYGEQRRELEKKLKDLGAGPDGPRRGPDAPPPAAGKPAESADVKAVRKQMQELAEKAPKAEPFQKEIFGLLTPDQQAAFKKQLEENEARRAKMRAERAKKGDDMKGGDGGDGGDGTGRGGKRGERGAKKPGDSGDGQKQE